MFFLSIYKNYNFFLFFFQAEDGIRDRDVTGVQTCALPICLTYVELAAGLVERRPHLTAPKVSTRTSERWASQPARITGATASVDAADIFAQNRPSLVMKPEMKTGSVPELALVRLTASRNSFQLKISERRIVAARPGALKGKMIRVMIRRNPAPSTMHASRISFGRSAKKERIIQITSGRLKAP